MDLWDRWRGVERQQRTRWRIVGHERPYDHAASKPSEGGQSAAAQELLPLVATTLERPVLARFLQADDVGLIPRAFLHKLEHNILQAKGNLLLMKVNPEVARELVTPKAQ